MFKSLPLLYSSHPSSYLFYFINQFIQRSKNTVAVVLVAWGGALMLVSRYFLTKNILNLVLTPGPSLRLETINLLGQVQHRQVPLSQVQVSSLLYLPSPSHPIPSHPMPSHSSHPPSMSSISSHVNPTSSKDMGGEEGVGSQTNKLYRGWSQRRQQRGLSLSG